LDISVPTILSTSLTVETGDKPESTKQNDIDQIESEDLTETNPKIEEQDLNNLTIPAVLMSDLDYSTDSDDSSSIIENKIRNNITMAQTSIDFINTASKLIPVFDSKAENLTSFIDALEIIHLHNIMEWNELYKLINNKKVDFDKSYKSLTQNRPIQKNLKLK